MEEIWAIIPGFEGRYVASNFGQIKSLGGCWTTRNWTYRTKDRIMKLRQVKQGYLVVGLHQNGKVKICRIHRLIAQAFIPNPENKPQVNHLNGITNDNKLENLEWATPLENMKHAKDNNLLVPYIQRPRLNKVSKRSKPVIKIDPSTRHSEIYRSITEASQSGHVYSAIRRVLTGENKTHHGYVWKYAI